MNSAPSASSGRLAYLDWARGFAALIMLQGHVFHSFTDKNLRDGSAYVLSQFVGGLTPAVFLFLTGVTLGFLMDSRALRGESPLGRVKAVLRRSGYLLGIAVLFRVQLWAFAAGQSHWTTLFKVDILNCMAFSIVFMAPLALLETGARARYAALAGAAVACASPLVSAADLSALHPFVAQYLKPDALTFSFFPWGAFVGFGVAAGTALRLTRESEHARLLQWGSMLGFGLIFAGRYFSDLPYSLYDKAEFWLDSPALIFIKTGLILLLLATAFLWTRYAAPSSWSWITQLGTHSLLVYWVHTELVYGRWFGQYKESLPAATTALAALVLVVSMVALSTMRTNWRAARRPLTWLPRPAIASRVFSGSPVSGD